MKILNLVVQFCHLDMSPLPIILALLPEIPATTTCIPTISNAIPMRTPTRAVPIAGDMSIIIESMTSNIPTPTLNPLDQPLLPLPPTPCAILEMPSNSNANAIKYIKNTVVHEGNAMAIPANIIISMPNPMVDSRDL